MEHGKAMRYDYEETDLRMFAHVSNAMELCSPGGVFIWNIMKLALMP